MTSFLHVAILLIVIIDFLKMSDEYLDLDSFLNDNYKPDFIQLFHDEYENLNEFLSKTPFLEEIKRGKKLEFLLKKNIIIHKL